VTSAARQPVPEAASGHQDHSRPAGHESRACPEAPGTPAGTELRHGYTLDSLTRMAHFAARRRKPWHRGVELSARYEVAWAAIAEHLYAAEEPPTSADLVRAAWEAIRHHADSRRQFLGRAHDGPDGPGRNFERYWRAIAGPADGPEERLIERLALAQIWPHLTPANRDALTALAVHDDYRDAAAALGIPYSTFKSRISEGRRQFLALWHDGETPSRPWARDRRAGPGTDMHTVTYFLRLRRQRAAHEQDSQL
jgi:DNA-directed RNA polymerase specialized sigma24 family protein